VNAISRITKDIPIKAVLIGRGPELNKIKKLINTLQLEQVLIATDADDHEKFRLIKSAKLFVLPSYEEGWGIVIGEALACGTNVLAYDVKEIQTIWGDSVTWVEKGNIDMLATGIQDILAAPPLRTDEDFWQTALSWENILDEEVNYFDSAKSIEQ
jgi:glycosyltransferase involved in cell wall biosynthesis